MDNDDYRRGRLTVHKKFGEAAGILAGDALLSRAAKVLASGAVQFGASYAAAAQVMTSAAEDMVRGQVLDLGGMRTEEEFRAMYALKTGALFRAAFLSGAIAAGADDAERRLVANTPRRWGSGSRWRTTSLTKGRRNLSSRSSARKKGGLSLTSVRNGRCVAPLGCPSARSSRRLPKSCVHAKNKPYAPNLRKSVAKSPAF